MNAGKNADRNAGKNAGKNAGSFSLVYTRGTDFSLGTGFGLW